MPLINLAPELKDTHTPTFDLAAMFSTTMINFETTKEKKFLLLQAENHWNYNMEMFENVGLNSYKAFWSQGY